jgi:hypothetical protein
MTPQQYVSSALYNLLMANAAALGESLDPTNTQNYANGVASLYTLLILPNLLVDLTTGLVSFVVPSS